MLQKSVKLSAQGLVANTFKETAQKTNNIEENTLIYIANGHHLICASVIIFHNVIFKVMSDIRN